MSDLELRNYVAQLATHLQVAMADIVNLMVYLIIHATALHR